jgi:methylamine---glutamate N-methyltransferase subunit A
MCGIVGLLLKDKRLRPRLGELMVPMLIGMSDRGPDSAGLAVFTDVPSEAGRKMSVYKGVGSPSDVAIRYDFRNLRGTHLIGHTRMATESAVTPENTHPYTAGEDFCLVHNGSLSNPHSVRRRLKSLGIRFEGDCDTEAACRFLEYRMREGDDLQTALQAGFEALDGFYTFLMGTADSLALVRDPFACKPAVVAETDDYVAIASEFRSLAKLPGVANASLFEPKPEQIYIWRTAA